MTTKEEQLKTSNTNLELQAQKELKLHKKAVNDSNNPLTIVREKEVEIKKHLLEMQIKADKIIEKAKQEAKQIRKDMASRGEKEATAYYKSEVIKIEKRVQKIKDLAPQKVKEISKEGLGNLDKTINQLKSILLPGTER